MSSGKLRLDDGWKLRWSDGQRGNLEFHHELLTDEAKWLAATVPGSVHLDLMKHSLLEDPGLGLNCLASRWVEECYWSYRLQFEAPAEAAASPCRLLFHGLDYNAVIYLNGRELGRHSNYYTPCSLDVTDKLLPGTNLLVVVLESGLFEAAGRSMDGLQTNTRDEKLHKRVWIRKPQYSFGWDWSPRLLNVGIHKLVELEWHSALQAECLSVSHSLNGTLDCGRVTAKVALTSRSASQTAVEAELCLEIPELGLACTRRVPVSADRAEMELELEAASPELWWPRGYGEQRRYEVRVVVRLQEETVLAESRRIGFRHVMFDESPHPRGGRYCMLLINGIPVFARGANIVPSDILLGRVDEARYRILIDRALEAGFNFLRVWGGGIYEEDVFYELCDWEGIMVWQDFMFACLNYPAHDAGFLANVVTEAEYHVRRLAHRASLVIWCGNNEIEWLTGNRREGIVMPDHFLYHSLLPDLVRRESPGMIYRPGSPYSPDGAKPNDPDSGDQHPWDIGFWNQDFRAYRQMTCRFPNEGGMLGPVSLPAMLAALPEGQRHMTSFAWQVHDNSIDRWGPLSTIDPLVTDWIGSDPRVMELETFVYYGGLLQGEGIREYIDNFRRRKYDSAAAVFWMFNDCWPAARSWTVVDYLLNRTPAFYPVKRAFASIYVVLSEEDGVIRVHGINDLLEPWSGTVHYGIFCLDGMYIMDREQHVRIPANSSVILAEFETDSRVADGLALPFAELRSRPDGMLAARNRLIQRTFGEMSWPGQADIELRREGDYAVFCSPVFVWGVCIDLEGDSPLTDNFFDLWPGRDYLIKWPQDLPLPAILYTGNLDGGVRHGEEG